MANDEEDLPPSKAESAPPRRRSFRRAMLVAAGLLLLGLCYAWFTREKIADDVISGQLEALGLPARYEIVSIGPRRQVLRNVVVGDPARPDLTIERAELAVSLAWGQPRISQVSLTRPRLYGSYRGGKLSFGSLDPVIFTDSKKPFRLPDMQLAIIDGRGLIDSDFGSVGIKLDGRGPLRSGFSGTLAAVAPNIRTGDCRANGASLYGSLAVGGEKPRFTGPLRLRGLNCASSRLALADVQVQLDGTADKRLDGAEGKLGLRTGRLALGSNRLATAGGSVRFVYRKQALTARYALSGRGVDTPQAALASLGLSGVVRTNGGLARTEIEGELHGGGIRLGSGLDAMLANAQKAAQGSLAAPLIGQIRTALRRESAASSLAGSFLLRRAGGKINLVVPQASLRGGSGATLLSLSRLQLANGEGPPRLTGNFATGGEGLPRIAGRMERGAGGQVAMRVAMAEYRAGDARVAVPRLTLVQLAGGALGFAGEARLSGVLPGGHADGLQLPIDGNWSPARGLAVWRHCTELHFDRLVLANLIIERRPLSLCPPKGGAIVRADDRGLRVAAGAPSLDVAGRLGASPIRIRSGPLGIAVPGMLTARALDVALGPAATASRFRIANLDARIGKDVAGRFSGSDVLLSAVPLDLRGAEGRWRYANGRLMLSEGSFRLEDRQVDDRFQPLIARDATLDLFDNRITAHALLREPQSDREVVRTTIHHDLASGRGDADLGIDGILFDDKLQPDTISRLALGIVANAQGTVRGSGRIAWNAAAVTSTGSFTTDWLDFAAAFGPVKGTSGTVVFTDLLGLVTAPDQELRVASINPGIEVNDGVVTFALQPGSVLAVKGGSWPFLDGRLTLRPVTMKMGVAETRRFVLVIEGLNAARFVERMELANMAATGTFDGALPLVFDENGGRIEGGLLTSRLPGGNVSYVGALTYKDLSPMANFAFDALKSMNYREMTIGMDGALEGEIVTRVRFRGVSQGQGTKRNFLTDRIARLPIQFNVNVRAPFQKLITSFKSFYDPAYVRDPRTLGLMDSQGRVVPRPSSPVQP